MSVTRPGGGSLGALAFDPALLGPGPKGSAPLAGFARWGGAVAVVLAVHAAGGWLAVTLRTPAPPESDGLPPAILLDLAPVAAAPSGELTDLPPGPPMVEAAPEPVPEPPVPVEVPPDEIPPLPVPVPDPVVEPVPEPVEMPAPDPLPVKLDTPEMPVPPPAAVILPPSRPVVAQKPPPPARKVESRKAVNKELPPAARTTADAGAPNAAAAPAAPGTGMGTASKAALATWRGRLIAHLNRHKRFPAGVRKAGVVTVAVTLDRSGAVLSARLVKGSGEPALDDDAVALMKRASPLPAPPEEVSPGRATISFAVPVDYARR